MPAGYLRPLLELQLCCSLLASGLALNLPPSLRLAAAGPSNRPALVPGAAAKPPPAKSCGGAAAKPSKDALAARLEGLLGGPGGGETQVGFGPPSGSQAAGSARSAPARTGGDPRKRIVPEATGQAGAMPPPPPRQPAAAAAAGASPPAAKRQRADKGAPAGSGRAAAAQHAGPAAGHHAAAGAAAGPPLGAAPGAWGAPLLLAAPAVKSEWTVRFKSAAAGVAADSGEAAAQPRELHIANRCGPAGGRCRGPIQPGRVAALRACCLCPRPPLSLRVCHSASTAWLHVQGAGSWGPAAGRADLPGGAGGGVERRRGGRGGGRLWHAAFRGSGAAGRLCSGELELGLGPCLVAPACGVSVV